MWNKRKWYSLLLAGFVLILATTVMACGTPTTTPPTTTTKTKTVTATATVTVPFVATTTVTTTATAVMTMTVTATATPRGSVLEQEGYYPADSYFKVDGDRYWEYIIKARVQNVGDDGVITFMAEITPADYVYEGLNTRYTEVYLRQGEEKQVNFDFDVLYPNEGFQYSVKCVP